MSRYKSVRKAEEFEDLSIVLQEVRNYQTLLSAPEIEYAARDYVQRSDKSGLPDGSVYDEKLSAPLGENLDKFCARLSRQANEAWKAWVNCDGNPIKTKSGEDIIPLHQPIEEFLLNEEDKVKYLRLTRLLFVEDANKKKREVERVARKCSESVNFKNEVTRQVTIPETSREYIKVTSIKDQFGNITFREEKYDRLVDKSGILKDKLTIIPGISVADIKQVTGGPSYQERLNFIVLSDYQTSKWRKDASHGKDAHLIPNTSPKDDPDYCSPLSISSRNFNIYPPAPRPYNIVFRVYSDKNNYTRSYPTTKGKDYTSLSTIQYMLKQQGKCFHKVTIDRCSFEVDLRVTYSDTCIPDPNSYKKVDPESKLGMWLLQKLDSDPYSFKEYSWDTVQDGETVRVSAVGYQINHPSLGVPRIYWVYLDANKAQLGSTLRWIPNPKNIVTKTLKGREITGRLAVKSKLVHPHIVYRPMYYISQEEHFTKVSKPFIATLRVSDNYYSRNKEGKVINLDSVKEVFFELLQNNGYTFITQNKESDFSTVLLFHFIHNSLDTKQKRKDFFRSFHS
jgi:hypothetical protein